MDRIDKTWDNVWKDFSGLNIFGKLMFINKGRAFEKVLKIFIPKDFSIIDVGCGSGNVLAIFRKLGYKNSIGIDPSENALKNCKKKGFVIGKDVFKGDSTSWKKRYDVVWSDGLLEHFDYIPMKEIVRDFVRISKRFIGFAQPNPDSLIGKLSNKSGWEWERPYKEEDYIRVFESLGCNLIHSSKIHFREQFFFIFEKNGL